jgi:imidazolonepropionase-like amidohydrolase
MTADMQSGRLILTDATILDGDHPPMRGTVVVAGDRLESVGATPVMPQPGDRVIALGGRTVMPGMVQSHFHAAYWNTGNSGRPLGMEVPPALAAVRAAANLRTALECGFTSVIGAGAPFAIDAAMKMAIAEGALVGPRIMAGSCDVSSTGHSADMSYPSWLKIGAKGAINRADGPEAVRRAIREEIKDGAEIIKLFVTGGHGTLGTGADWAMAADELTMAVQTATERGVKVRAHIASKAATLLALALGVHIIDHGDGFDDECMERMLARNAFLTPSLLFPKRMMSIAPGIPYTEAMKPDFDAMAAILPRLNAAGIKLLIGDDFGAAGLPHGTYAEELALYVDEIGIPALDVIRWATKHGAEAMGQGAEVGTLTPGKLADLLVIDGDPLTDITVFQDRSRLLAILKGGVAIKDELAALSVGAMAGRA